MADLPSNLPRILRDAGLRVVEVDGWRHRGRPAYTGGFAPVGVLCHHTASSADGWAGIPILREGRSDLPGPLCQLALDRSGTVFIVAAGRSNHAGTAKASGSVAAGDGNRLYIGIEAMNRGTGERWPEAQYDAYVLLAATLCREITGNSAQTVRAHKETSTTGKIDPHGPTPYEDHFDMGAFRSRVAAAMKDNHKPVPEEDDVTPEDIEKIANLTAQKVRQSEYARYDGPGGSKKDDPMRWIQHTQQARGFSMASYREARQAKAAIRALARGLGTEVEQAVESALKDAAVEVTVDVTQSKE